MTIVRFTVRLNIYGVSVDMAEIWRIARSEQVRIFFGKAIKIAQSQKVRILWGKILQIFWRG